MIDAAHDAHTIVEAVGGRFVKALVCTHGHNDHINAAVDFAALTGAPIWLHPDDRMLWDAIHPDRAPDARPVRRARRIDVGDVHLQVMHTPGQAVTG